MDILLLCLYIAYDVKLFVIVLTFKQQYSKNVQTQTCNNILLTALLDIKQNW